MLALTMLGFALRAYWLGRQSLWCDEAFSWIVARADWSAFWQALLADGVHPPGYYLLLRPCLALFGEGEFALRFLSLAAGALTVPLMWRLGRRLGGRRWGLAAAALLAVNPFAIWYAQDARMYSLLLCLGIAAGYAFWRLTRQPGWGSWAWLTAITACGFLVHYFALVLSVSQFVYLVLDLRRAQRVLRWWALAQAIAFLPFLPWAYAIATREGRNLGIGWILPVTLVDLPLTLTNLAFGLSDPGSPWTWAGLALITAVAVVTGIPWRPPSRTVALDIRRAPAREPGNVGPSAYRCQRWLLTWLVAPMAFIWLISLRRPLYVDRYFIICLAPLLLLTGALSLSRRRLARGMMLAVVVISAAASVRVWLDLALTKEDWRAAAAHIEAREAPGDTLVVRDFQTGMPFVYYYRGSLQPQVADINRQLTPLETAAASHRRLWLVYRRVLEETHQLAGSQPFTWRNESEPVFLDWLLDHQSGLVDERTWPGVVVMLYELNPVTAQQEVADGKWGLSRLSMVPRGSDD